MGENRRTIRNLNTLPKVPSLSLSLSLSLSAKNNCCFAVVSMQRGSKKEHNNPILPERGTWLACVTQNEMPTTQNIHCSHCRCRCVMPSYIVEVCPYSYFWVMSKIDCTLSNSCFIHATFLPQNQRNDFSRRKRETGTNRSVFKFHRPQSDLNNLLLLGARASEYYA